MDTMLQQPDKSTEPRILVQSSRVPWHKANGVKRLSVFLGLTAAFSVFLMAAGILYYRYLTVQQPTCSVWVMGSSAFEGATITVSSLSLETPLRDTIRANARFSARFFMNPGKYHITITDKDGKSRFDDTVDLYPSFPRSIDLTRPKPETPPS